MSVPMYEGKPTAYLDHNILDLLLKNPMNDLTPRLRGEFQVIYSDETLSEIKRTGERGGEFLELLASLSAMHIRVQLSRSFDVTDIAILDASPPASIFQSYLENSEQVFDRLIKSTSQSLLKFYGGREGATMDDIREEQADAFFGLLGDLLVKAGDIESLSPDLHGRIIRYVDHCKAQFIAVQSEAARGTNIYPSDSLVTFVQNYREVTGVGPKQLNNIEHPNVIEKIWALHKFAPGHVGFTIEQFLGISKAPFQNRELYLHEKVRSCYNVLNVIGYHQDSKLKAERRFNASMSDAGHAAMGSFADYIFSRDQAFIKKSSAIYEYLKAKTKVMNVLVS